MCKWTLAHITSFCTLPMYGINSLVSTCYVTHLITHALLQSMISITSAAWRCSVPSSLAIFLLLFHAIISSTYGRAQNDGSPSENEGSPESPINNISPRELSSNEQHALQKAAMLRPYNLHLTTHLMILILSSHQRKNNVHITTFMQAWPWQHLTQ